MNVTRLVSLAFVVSAVGVVVACSSSSDGDDDSSITGNVDSGGGSNDSGGSGTIDSGPGPIQDSGSGGGACAIIPGSYTTHYTSVFDGGPACGSTPADKTFDYPEPEFPADGGFIDGGGGTLCNMTSAPASSGGGCVITYQCSAMNGSGSEVITFTQNIEPDGTWVTGTYSVVGRYADGGLIGDCEYTTTSTKN
ncbi:MAG TPA: hypothetical protein VF407_23760 [Polyangiaceae bacterium]